MEEQGFSFQIRNHLTHVCKEKGITLLHHHQGEKFHQLLDLITFSSLGNLNDAVEYLLASSRLVDSLELYWIHGCDNIMEDLIFQLWKKVFIQIKYKLYRNTMKPSSITEHVMAAAEVFAVYLVSSGVLALLVPDRPNLGDWLLVFSLFGVSLASLGLFLTLAMAASTWALRAALLGIITRGPAGLLPPALSVTTIAINNSRGIEEMITYVQVNHVNEIEVKNYLKMARSWFLREGRRYHERLMEHDQPEIEHLDVFQSKCAFCGSNAKDDRRLKIHQSKCERYQYFKKKMIVI